MSSREIKEAAEPEAVSYLLPENGAHRTGDRVTFRRRCSIHCLILELSDAGASEV